MAALAVALVAATGPAHAQAPAGLAGGEVRQQVRALVHEAGQRMDRGDRAGAAALLQQAQALSPDPSLDYNLGIVYAEMAQHPQAAAALQRFVRSADRSAVLSDRLEDAQRRLDTYQRTLARLSVKAELPAGARSPSLVAWLVIDQQQQQQQPVALPTAAPLWLVPGEHRVRVSAEGTRPYEVHIDLAPGQLRELSAELLPPVALTSVVPVTAELQHAHDSAEKPLYKKWWFWTVIGGGAVSVLGLTLIAAGAAGKLNHVTAGSDLDPVDVAR